MVYEKPTLLSNGTLQRITPQVYERYIPSAFDESLTILEKLNKVIIAVNQIGCLSNDLVDQWNDLWEWIQGEGLQEIVNEKLTEWLTDGTLEDILKNVLLSDYATKDWVTSQIATIMDEVNKLLNVDKNNAINVTVGNGGDYTSINKAIDYIVNRPILPFSATITLLNGYVWNEQVAFINKNLGFLTITAQDDMVRTDTSVGWTECYRQIGSPEFETIPALYGLNSVMPTWDVKLNLTKEPDMEHCIGCQDNRITGVYLDHSSMIIRPNKGFVFAPFYNLIAVSNSHVSANYGIFDDGGNRGNIDDATIDQAYGGGVMTWNSVFTGSYATAHRGGEYGFQFNMSSIAFINKAKANGCGHHALMASTGSGCSAREVDMSDTIDDNIVAYAGSNIDARDSISNGSHLNYGVIATRGSSINFENGQANNCGYSGIMANRNSTIDATGATVTGSKVDGVRAAQGSTVLMSSGTISNSAQDGAGSEHGAKLVLNGATITNSGRYGLLCYDSQINAMECTIDGTGDYGVDATRGGFVDLNSAIIKNTTGKAILAYGTDVHFNEGTIINPGERGIECTQGGRVQAHGCNISGATDKGILNYGSNVNCYESTISAGVRAIETTAGGYTIASNTVINGGAGYNVYNGGVINASGGNGSANRTVNTITTDGLIIM